MCVCVAVWMCTSEWVGCLIYCLCVECKEACVAIPCSRDAAVYAILEGKGIDGLRYRCGLTFVCFADSRGEMRRRACCIAVMRVCVAQRSKRGCYCCSSSILRGVYCCVRWKLFDSQGGLPFFVFRLFVVVYGFCTSYKSSAFLDMLAFTPV